jgi:hypothetical protein
LLINTHKKRTIYHIHRGCITTDQPYIVAWLGGNFEQKFFIQHWSYFQPLRCYGRFQMYKQQLPTCVYFDSWQHWWRLRVNMLPLPIPSAPRFGQVATHLNQRYENHWIGCRGPIVWPWRSPDLTPLHFLLLDLLKEMTYRTKVHERGTAASDYGYCCLHTGTRNDSTTVNSCLERARLCIENRGGNSYEQLQDVSNKI